jgi:hypothetical protein
MLTSPGTWACENASTSEIMHLSDARMREMDERTHDMRRKKWGCVYVLKALYRAYCLWFTNGNYPLENMRTLLAKRSLVPASITHFINVSKQIFRQHFTVITMGGVPHCEIEASGAAADTRANKACNTLGFSRKEAFRRTQGVHRAIVVRLGPPHLLRERYAQCVASGDSDAGVAFWGGETFRPRRRVGPPPQRRQRSA